MKKGFGILALSLVCSAPPFAEGQTHARSVCAASEKHYAAIRTESTDCGTHP